MSFVIVLERSKMGRGVAVVCRCGATHYRKHHLCRECHTKIQPVPNGGLCGKCGKEHTNRHYWCKDCFRQYDRARSKTKNSKIREKSKTPKARLKQLLSATTTDRSQLNFDILWKRLEEIGFKCEITGVNFEYEPRNPKSMSIDRIDCSKPYTHDNVRFVCLWINLAMSNWGLEKLKELVNDWRRT